jgi:hypothetical protein
MSDPSPTPDDQAIVERLRSELQKTRPSRKRRAIEKFFLAALGSIPWVGGFLSAAAAFKVEETSIKSNSLQTEWLEEHQEKLEALQETLAEIQRRFEAFGAAVEERIQSKEFLGLVRKAFRVWDAGPDSRPEPPISTTLMHRFLFEDGGLLYRGHINVLNFPFRQTSLLKHAPDE